MSYYVKVKLLIAGTDTGDFSISAYYDNITTLLVTGITKNELISGYNIEIPDDTTIIIVKSNTSECKNQIFIPINGETPIPTPYPIPTPTAIPSPQIETLFIHIPNL